MRSRKVSDLNADVLKGHYSTALCHLANVSIRLGGKVPFKPQPAELAGDPDVSDVLERMEQYLAANGMDLESSRYTLGRKLTIDKMSETVIDYPEANDLLTRHYRKPFEVPDKA